MTQPKTQQIKELKQSKLQLEIKKDSAQIELDKIIDSGIIKKLYSSQLLGKMAIRK